MGTDFFVYTASPLFEGSDLVHLRDWKQEGGAWICRTKSWQIVVNASENVDQVDTGPEMPEIRSIGPNIQYRTEINLEGRPSGEAHAIAFASAQKVAFRHGGVVYEPQQDFILVPFSEGVLANLPKLRLRIQLIGLRFKLR
jgi:hypothetical protein